MIGPAKSGQAKFQTGENAFLPDPQAPTGFAQQLPKPLQTPEPLRIPEPL